MLRKLFAVLFVILAARAGAAERTHAVTPDDYASVATITEFTVSPDGQQVAFALSTWDKADDGRKTDLWVVSTSGKTPARRLTFDRANDRRLKWAADGSAVYFLANRRRANESKPPFDGATQVWRIKPNGGAEPQAVTRVSGGVSDFDLASKAGAIFYVTEKTHTDHDDFAKLRSRFPADYGHGSRKISEVHRLDLTTWRAQKVIDEQRYIREFAATPDGRRIAMVSAFDDTVIKSEGESRVDIWEQGEPRASAIAGAASPTEGRVTTPPMDVYRKDAASPHAWLESLAWSPDGNRFAFCAIFDAYPTEIIHGEATGSKWNLTRMPRPAGQHVRGYGSPLRWNEFGRLVYLGEKTASVFPVAYNPATNDAGSARTWSGKVVSASERDGGQSVVLVALEPHGFPDLYAVDSRGTNPQRLTDVNPQTATWKMPSVKHVTWKAPDGTEVGGVLELPPGYKTGDRLPLVVAIHGGPTTSTRAELIFDPHNGRLYFSAAGYAVLAPNYRGSTGYGDKFVTDLIGRENDVDVSDILAGIRHLIAEGIADPNRVGVMGWSNGGYLTNCLITRKDSPVKIAAASSGAGILDTVAEWGFNDEPAYPRVFKKGHPWEAPEEYRKSSATYGLGRVKTPTLIHVGGNDERCPPGHSRMLYRALKEYVKVPTELVVYPGEPHGLGKLSHRRAKMEWDLAWFEKYLKNAAK